MTHDLFDAYRRILATTGSEEVWWWYFGTLMVDVDGLPSVPLLEAETIMAYRTQTLSPDSFRIHWREIGYFRDPRTGEIAAPFVNPITGHQLTPPRSFLEGPGHYTITRTEAGVRLDIVQPHANIQSADVTLRELPGGRVLLQQTERKTRGLPLPDGTMPKEGMQAHTVLSFFANAADLDKPSAQAEGSYSFTLDGLAPWLGLGARTGGSTVHGILTKSTPAEHQNATAQTRLLDLFPQFRTEPLAPAF